MYHALLRAKVDPDQCILETPGEGGRFLPFISYFVPPRRERENVTKDLKIKRSKVDISVTEIEKEGKVHH